MKNHTSIVKWANDSLISKGYSLVHSPEIVVQTPWSNVIRFSTSTGNNYLKQTPPAIFLEAKVMQLLADKFHASVPIVIASNVDLHCFLMRDAGETLRHYLQKTEFCPELMTRAINEFTIIQRETETQIQAFFTLGVPDWRLDKLPKLYSELIKQEEFLNAEGMTDNELQVLRDLSQKFSDQCELLSQYQIPATLVQSDFHSNNILFNPNTQKITFIDLGETVITHPFFSLHTFLHQAIIHHSVKELDQTYHQLQNTCFENWLELLTKNQLLEVFKIAKELWPIYSALGAYRLMSAVDLRAFKSYYANRPNRLTEYLREYITGK